jgi:DNA-binding CsgD family transcriptional regulator
MAISLGAEDDFVKELTGTHIAPYGTMLLVGYQGRPEEALALISATSLDAAARGEGLGVQLASWAKAILHNGRGQYEEALDAAEQARDEDAGPFISAWVLPELIEAANRAGRPQVAADALERLAESIIADEPDWAAGIYARSRALVVAGDLAERCYVEAIERLSRTPLRPEIGRAHLLYGEWLRREGRRIDARHQLRLAYDLFATLGAEGFAERSRRELLATGETVRKRSVDAHHELTPQEEYIARLAREGRTNPQIGSELFISARTVEWHLRKVFTKLGITSRKDLHNVLPDRVAQGAR